MYRGWSPEFRLTCCLDWRYWRLRASRTLAPALGGSLEVLKIELCDFGLVYSIPA